jgi:hypothetical protein
MTIVLRIASLTSSSNSLLPLSIVAGGMKSCKDNYGVHAYDVKDAIGKPLCKYAMNLRVFPEKHVRPRILDRTLDGRANLSRDFESEPSFPAFIPNCGVDDVRFGLWSDNQAAVHPLIRL